jgi:hypothetical protein
MFGLSIKSWLLGLFALMVTVVGGQGYLAVSKMTQVNDGVVDLATNWHSRDEHDHGQIPPD